MKLTPLLFPLFLALALPTLACGLIGGAEPEATAFPADPTATPTEAPPTAPPPSPTPLPDPTATATSQPEATATTAAQAATPTTEPLELAAPRYTHRNGIFSLQSPAGWSATEDDGSASFTSSDGAGYLHVEVTNTGYELAPDAFASFVENRDLNFFSVFEDYLQLEQEIDAEGGIATITKNFVFEQAPQTAVTVYLQDGLAIYAVDAWSDQASITLYSDLYPRVIETMELNREAAAEQLVYNWIYTFEGPDGLFTIDVPTPWEYERTESDVVIVDTFYAPDEHAVIQNIAYDDGEEISRSEAGAFALELLRTYYAQDIRILDDQVQPDGSERLIWTSSGGGYSGTSFLETRGTTFLLFTIMHDDAYEDIYLDTLTYTVETYTVPE